MHWQGIEQAFAGGGDAVALHFQLQAKFGFLDHFAQAFDFRILHRSGGSEVDGDDLEIGEAIDDVAERAIKEDGAFVDDDHALAECLDIRHVMAGEEDGGFAA